MSGGLELARASPGALGLPGHPLSLSCLPHPLLVSSPLLRTQHASSRSTDDDTEGEGVQGRSE